jgi:hypothetical protein
MSRCEYHYLFAPNEKESIRSYYKRPSALSDPRSIFRGFIFFQAAYSKALQPRFGTGDHRHQVDSALARLND